MDFILSTYCRLYRSRFGNGVNMAGQYNGVQAELLQINEWARFVPCVAHCLNLIGLLATEKSQCMIMIFETVQRMFTYFSVSTLRWYKLITVIKIILKSHLGTRWPLKNRAVSTFLYKQKI